MKFEYRKKVNLPPTAASTRQKLPFRCQIGQRTAETILSAFLWLQLPMLGYVLRITFQDNYRGHHQDQMPFQGCAAPCKYHWHGKSIIQVPPTPTVALNNETFLFFSWMECIFRHYFYISILPNINNYFLYKSLTQIIVGQPGMA